MATKQYGRPTKEMAEKFAQQSPAERINSILGNKTPEDQRFLSGFVERQCKLKEIKDISPGSSRVTFAFKVDRYYCNPSNNLHGGAQSAIYDTATSIALQALSNPGSPWSNGGVTRALNVTYLRGAPEGEDLLLDCEIVHTGQRLGLLRGTIKRERDGAIISTCEHDKASVPVKAGWKL